MKQYGNPQFWDERYAKETEPFDWYQRYSGLRDHLANLIHPESKILNVGSGTSRLSEEMFEDGFTNITNIDISSVATKLMQDKYKDKGPDFKYLQMDAKKLEFEANSFDCIIDKGTLDSILVTHKTIKELISFNQKCYVNIESMFEKCGESSNQNCTKAVSEIYRTLNNGGAYVIVSYGSPDSRRPYLQKPEYAWEITEIELKKPSVLADEQEKQPEKHYLYICKKSAAGEAHPQ